MLTQLTCISPLTPSRATLRPARHSRAHRIARTSRHITFLHPSSLFCCHRITQRYVCHRQSNLNQIMKQSILLTQLSEILNLIRAERAANKRNVKRYSNLRHALRNIREELKSA